MSTSAFAISSFDRVVDDDGDATKLWVIEARDLARGFCGALFLGLPLLYTLEMWERARIIPNWDLALIVVLAYFGNVGFALFEGFKQQPRRKAAWLDAITAMGIGIVASAITLVLINQLAPGVPGEIGVKLVLLEMVPSSFGASLAINQLSRVQSSKLEEAFSLDAKKLLATTLGALMFSFNIAPTFETQIIGNGLSSGHLVGLVLFSLVVSALMTFFADFVERATPRGVLAPMWIETLVAYLVSLTVSALLLWMFGYIDFGMPFHLVVAWVATLGYVTTVAGAAGRLII